MTLSSLDVRAEDCIDYRGLTRLVASVDTPDSALSVTVDGAYAYIADRAGLQVADVSDPESPWLAGGVSITGGVHKVVVAGGYAYTVGSYGLHAVDISDPGFPVRCRRAPGAALD